MARAYAYAMGSGPIPKEWRLLNAIDRFGVDAVMGRQLYANEITRMGIVDKIITGYLAKTNSGDWAKWEQNNREWADLVNAAGKLAVEMGLIKELGSE